MLRNLTQKSRNKNSWKGTWLSPHKVEGIQRTKTQILTESVVIIRKKWAVIKGNT